MLVLGAPDRDPPPPAGSGLASRVPTWRTVGVGKSGTRNQLTAAARDPGAGNRSARDGRGTGDASHWRAANGGWK